MSLNILSAGAVKAGVAQMSEAFARARGVPVKVEFKTAPGVRDSVLAGASPDVVIAPPAFLDELTKAGRIIGDSRCFLGRARMGVAVHANSEIQQVADVEALKRMLSAASAVVYNKASSGIYSAKLLQDLGITDATASRVQVVPSGAAVLEYVASHGPDAIGLAQISEIRVLIDKGLPVRIAGPLPDAVQNVTSYEAAVLSGSSQLASARALAAFLGGAEAKAAFAATGID